MRTLIEMHNDDDHPGWAYCTRLLDVFIHQSPHGAHFGLVFEPFSLSLLAYCEAAMGEEGVGFTIKGLKNIVQQTLLAVSYLHAFDFAHTGT